jgi:hypothetical protein
MRLSFDDDKEEADKDRTDDDCQHKKEMQLPRLTESVRKVLESGNSPVGEDPAGRSERQ